MLKEATARVDAGRSGGRVPYGSLLDPRWISVESWVAEDGRPLTSGRRTTLGLHLSSGVLSPCTVLDMISDIGDTSVLPAPGRVSLLLPESGPHCVLVFCRSEVGRTLVRTPVRTKSVSLLLWSFTGLLVGSGLLGPLLDGAERGRVEFLAVCLSSKVVLTRALEAKAKRGRQRRNQ